MTSSTRDRAFLADCILAGGGIRDLAMWAVETGWSARKFRVFCEFASMKGDRG